MKNKILFILSLLFGLMMINAGLDKLFHYMPKPENMSENSIKTFNALVAIGWLMPLVAVVEIIGGLLFIFPKTRALGALIILPVMVGILLTNIVTDTSALPIALIFVLIEIWALYDNREKYLPILRF